MEILNVGLIGYGISGAFYHAPIIEYSLGLNLYSVVTSKEDIVRAKYPKVKIYSSSELLFQDPSVDIVVIATPNHLHFDLAIEAIKNNKHVIIEKPFSITTSEAKKILEFSKKKKVIVSAYYNRRWDCDYLTIKKIINKEIVKEVKLFESYFDRYKPIVGDKWKECKLPGAGTLYDVAPHLLDQAIHLFGMPISIYAEVDYQRPETIMDDFFCIILTYPKMKAILRSSSIAFNSDLRFRVYGSNSMVIVRGRDAQGEMLQAGLNPSIKNWKPAKNMIVTLYDSKNCKEIRPEIGGYDDYYSKFRDAVITNSTFLIKADDILNSAILLDYAVLSHKLARSVKINE